MPPPGFRFKSSPPVVLEEFEDGCYDGGLEGREALLALSDEDLARVLRLDHVLDKCVVKDSSPGVPYSRLGSSNGVLLSSASGRSVIVSAVLSRFRLLLSTPLEELAKLNAEELVRGGFVDPVKIFIKSEPHKRQKLVEGKLRIISNVSLVDSVIERILFRYQNGAEIRHWRTCPSKPGMGLHDAGLKDLYDTFESQQREMELAESDVSGWDWNVKDWMMEDDMRCRARLAGARKGSAYWHMLMARYYTVSLKLFHLSSGEMIAQRVRGIQASGSYNTSAGNSRMRVILGYHAGVVWIMAMGDDDVENFDATGKVAQKYKLFGIPLKDYKKCAPGVVGFCSHTWNGDWRASPDNVCKTLYRFFSHTLSSRTCNPEFRAQLEMDIRHHPDKEYILSRVDSIIELESKHEQQ